MIDFIKGLFGDKQAREVHKLQPLVDEINEVHATLTDLSEEALRAKTSEFKQEIQEAVADIEARQEEVRALLRGTAGPVGGDGQAAEELSLEDRRALLEELDDLDQDWLDIIEDVLNDLLPEAFAVVKETCRRMVGKSWIAGGSEVTWNMVPYDVQLLGGIAIHQGRIAEMKTGEGKTLVAVAPVYLNALAGRGVHLVTVNPYLAQRDAEWMRPIYEFLGLTVGIIDQFEPHSTERRAAYQADITYGTNNEFGFDYLRDNSFVVDPEQLVQREHHFAIVDEVDSVLIDEARTPLIISGPVPQANDGRFIELNPPIAQLVRDQMRIVAGLVSEAEQKLQARDEAVTAGDKKKAREMEDEAGLAILRASRGFPKNNKLQKLLQEPGVDQLRLRTEAFYLQDSGKQMHIVDDALHYSIDEKNHAIEMTDQGRGFAAKAAGDDISLFVLPDLGEETAKFDEEEAQRLAELPEDADEAAQDEIKQDIAQRRQDLNTLYADRAERLHAIEQLLRAYTLYEKDIEYIVQEGRVQIVDKHTGRVLSGRRYSDGLHQAIEAKEGVKVQAATQTYATVTLQNYFRMYHKLSGMTGTAETEAEEFYKIYKMDVVVVPTNKPIAREDLDDLVYKTRREKYRAVIERIRGYHEAGQPVLVGTTSVEVSETLSRMLKRSGIKHNVLNARRDRAKQESDIVAEAGKRGAVTIATNMAGRGTDIKLMEEILDIGGLAIIGTERHESRRIDLQLRGRSGRQGDPGESQFYISLEDNLMRLFMSDRVSRVMDRLGLEEGEVITHPWVNKSIERAQKKVEQNNFAIRKRQLEYDDVLNAQRQVIYDRRDSALKGDRLHGEILEMLHDLVAEIVTKHFGNGDFEEMREELLRLLAVDVPVEREQFVRLGEDGLTEHLYDKALAHYRKKRETLAKPFDQAMQQLMQQEPDKRPSRVSVDFTEGRRLLRTMAKVEDAVATHGQEINDALERTAVLSTIDEKWTDHLRMLDEVKEGIGLRAYGQQDPLVAYKMEAFKLFSEMMEEISREVVSLVFRAGPLVNAQPNDRRAAPRSRMDRSRAQARHDSMEPSYGVGGNGAQQAADRDPSVEQQPVTVDKIGRNEVVTVQNAATGETRKVKYKHAERMIEKGWSLVS